MAISFIAYLDGTASASSSTCVFDTSGRSVGDVGLVFISRNGSAAPTGVPSGWTLLQSHESSYSIWLYGKVLASGDITTTLTWTWAAAAKVLGTAAFYNCGGYASPFASSNKGTYATASGTSCDCGSITSSNWLVQLKSCYSTASKTFNALTGYTERRDRGSTNPDFWQEISDTNGPWDGSASNPSFTISAAATYRGGFQVELTDSGSTAADSYDPMGAMGFFGV